VRVATQYAPAPCKCYHKWAVNMKTVKDYSLPLNSLKQTTTRKNKHCAILLSLCRHCQSKAKHSRIWAQVMHFLPIKQVDLWPSNLESGVWVTCDVGYLCANFSLPRPLCYWLRPDVRDWQTYRQTSDVTQTDVRQHHRLMPLPIRGGA